MSTKKLIREGRRRLQAEGIEVLDVLYAGTQHLTWVLRGPAGPKIVTTAATPRCGEDTLRWLLRHAKRDTQAA